MDTTLSLKWVTLNWVHSLGNYGKQLLLHKGLNLPAGVGEPSGRSRSLYTVAAMAPVFIAIGGTLALMHATLNLIVYSNSNIR